MQTYIGTKMLGAKPMTRGEYNEYRGWQLPDNENGADAGYLVEYKDGSAGNDSRHDGYISWSPEGVFAAAYDSVAGNLSFSHALIALQAGERVARQGWNGKGMWLILISGGEMHSTPNDIDYIVRDDSDMQFMAELALLPWIGMKTADGGFVPWLASQTDLLSRDWCVVQNGFVPQPAGEPEEPVAMGQAHDAILRNPDIPAIIEEGTSLSGLIYEDRLERFGDGTWVTTGKVTHFDAVNQLATTGSGTIYHVIREWAVQPDA